MLSRISILSIAVVLSIFLFGECRSESVGANVELPMRSIELSIVDADIPNPTSLLSGQNSTTSTVSARRCLQRSSHKRANNHFIATRCDMGVVTIGNTLSTLHINILGGVVANEAFYSLCCLRI